MASLTDEDEDDDEEFVPDRDKKVQPKELKSGRLIGKGRSSIVYETTWKGQSYARKDFLRVPSDVFEREAEVLARLDEHPNVTRTHCWSVSETSCSLVVDLMDDDLQNVMRNRRESAWQSLSPHPGSDDTSHVIDLHRFVEDAAPELRHPVASTLLSTFSMSEALHIMLQIAEGMVFLHENGVAHGDLKPKNILVAPSKQGARSLGLFHVKMADFGLVETKMKSKALASQRARKLEIARWRAPEVFENSYLLRSEDSDSDCDSDSGDHDGGLHTYEKLWRGDVYSFAVTSAKILTGEDPYSGLGLRELVSRISGPNGLRPGLPQRCPAQLSDLINRCWGDELKRPSFIDIRSELKNLQASLMSDSSVIRKTISNPVFEVQRYSEITSSNPAAPTLPRGDLEITEAVGGPPVKADTFSIKSNEGSPKLTPVPKPRKRRKVHGCLGCVPVKTIRRNEREDITTLDFLVVELKRRAKNKRKKNPFAAWLNMEDGAATNLKGARWFSFDDIKRMTNNFSDDLVLGQGGYGRVYKGIQADTGATVAVKRAQEGSKQGAQEFKNEIELLSGVHHNNLVGLVGFCFEKTEQMLVYEYVPNGTLSEWLRGARSDTPLDWERRLLIALGAARGLAYLHDNADPPIIHRDVKASNILLDKMMNAKVADFGLSLLVPDENGKPAGKTIKGTMGYLDPEYYMTNVLTTKIDVYSFGVVLLELLTGRPPIYHGGHIVRDVRSKLNRSVDEAEALEEIVEPTLARAPGVVRDELQAFLQIALACVEDTTLERPSMHEVVKQLEALVGPKAQLMPGDNGTGIQKLMSKRERWVPLEMFSLTSDDFEPASGQFELSDSCSDDFEPASGQFELSDSPFKYSGRYAPMPVQPK